MDNPLWIEVTKRVPLNDPKPYAVVTINSAESNQEPFALRSWVLEKDEKPSSAIEFGNSLARYLGLDPPVYRVLHQVKKEITCWEEVSSCV